MFAVISPAKKLAEHCDYQGTTSHIRFANETAQLVKQLKQCSAKQLANLMGLSDKLAQLNQQRYQDFKPRSYTSNNAIPAVYLFQGDVYRYLDVATLTTKQQQRLQQRVGILSGLYGLLQPLDLIQAYRLEMGTQLANSAGENLYALWRPLITAALNEILSNSKDGFLINLASKEYFSAIDTSQLDGTVIDIDFKDKKNGQLKTIGINAKRARGAMVRYLIQNNCQAPEDLCDFTELDYCFSKKLSTEHRLVFVR
jgi:uncharacterized protein